MSAGVSRQCGRLGARRFTSFQFRPDARRTYGSDLSGTEGAGRALFSLTLVAFKPTLRMFFSAPRSSRGDERPVLEITTRAARAMRHGRALTRTTFQLHLRGTEVKVGEHYAYHYS